MRDSIKVNISTLDEKIARHSLNRFKMDVESKFGLSVRFYEEGVNAKHTTWIARVPTKFRGNHASRIVGEWVNNYGKTK